MAKAIPDGYSTLTPIIVFKDARKAIEFYKKAFGAVEKFAMPGPGGHGIMHAEIQVGSSPIMVSDETPEHGKSAQTMNGSPVSFYLYVQDVDAAFARAVSAGATSKMPVADMFWGDRMGCVADPFGHTWMVATHTRDLTGEQIAQGAAVEYAKHGKR